MDSGKFLISRLQLVCAASLASLIAACGPAPTSAKSSITVASWGPRQTVQGKGINVQPNGKSAMWIKATGLPDSNRLQVKFGDFEPQPAKQTAAGVAASLPDALLTSVGKHRVLLIDADTGNEILVGTFEVLPAER